MRQRIIGAFLLLPLLAIVWFGNSWAFALLAGVVALLGIREFYNMVARIDGQPIFFLGFLFTSLFIANAYFHPYFNYTYTAPLFAAAVFIPLIWLLFRFPKGEAFIYWAWILAGMLYMGWMLSYYVALRGLDQGKEWVFLVLLSTSACDTAAFFVGRAWGRRPLAPTISPAKTWEGAIGGFIAAPAAALILYTVLDIAEPGYVHIILIGCLIGIFAQLGDLAESMLKRKAGVKDAGRLIPGHGGVLDRIDSLVFTGIIAYYYVIWMVQ
jgi:phosphatidate cytidylyltransferase